jgi:hypothetical protein
MNCEKISGNKCRQGIPHGPDPQKSATANCTLGIVKSGGKERHLGCTQDGSRLAQ